MESFGDVRVALIYPNSYEVGSASLSTHVLLKKFNEVGSVRAERFFYSRGFSKYYSFDSLTPLDEFRIWSFSVHYELDLLNVFDILNRFSIPLKKEERNSFHPVVVVGGAMTYFSNAVLAEVGDVVHKGDLSEEFLDCLSSVDHRMSREEIVATLTTKRVEPAFSNSLGESVFISSNSVFGDRYLIEIGRGCYRKCKFCVAGHRFGRPRFRGLKDTTELMDSVSPITKRFGLVAATVTDYPNIEEVAEHCIEKGYELSVSSLRLDSLSNTLLKALRLSKQSSFTIAPEGGSQRMRDAFAKGISERDILKALELGRENGFRRVKMYYIFGAAFEDPEDRREIVKAAKKALGMGYANVILSLNPLIPKPGTPFEGMPMEPIGNLRKYEREIRSELVLEGMKIDFESLRESKLQFALANIDREKGRELLELVERGIDPTPILNKYAEEVNLRRKEWNKHGKEEYSGR
jgi:radical SAM superfamily enzyme YgiQ (UPF0313 family)